MFTKDELELLEKALSFYANNGTKEEMFAELLLAGLTHKFSDETTEQVAERIVNNSSNLRDRIVLLKAKLVHLRDKNLVNEFTEDL